MKAELLPSELKGTVSASASKSAMQRACAAALLKKGRTILKKPGNSADDLAALDIIKQLGASISRQDKTIVIESKGISAVGSSLNCGESGLSVRMFTSIAALSTASITINGSGSLIKRPLNFFNDVLPLLNVQCESNNGYLPIKIKGPL